MNKSEHQIVEAQTATPDELPGFFDRAAKPLRNRKTDKHGNVLDKKAIITPRQKAAIDRRFKTNMADAVAEVKKLMSMKKTAEIDAMGFEPGNQSKEKDVLILLKRVVLGKPEFILKSNKKEVVPEASSLGGVTWAYRSNPMRKVVVNAVHFIRLTESRKITSIADLAPKLSKKAHEIINANRARFIRASAAAAEAGKPLSAAERARKDRVDAIAGRRGGLGSLWSKPKQKDARERERKARKTQNESQDFAYRKDKEQDGKYDLRAILVQKSVSGAGEPILSYSMFPGVQYKSTSNKYEFNRLLNRHIQSLKKLGIEVTDIHYRGSKEFSRFSEELETSSPLIEKIIKREDGKYEVVSKNGDRSFGTYSSEKAAEKRLRQIEFFKHMKG